MESNPQRVGLEPAPLFDDRQPSMFLFSLSFVASYLILLLVVGSVIEHYQLERSSFLSASVIPFAAVSPAWLFVRRYHRLFSSAERRRLTAFSVLWILAFESLILTPNRGALDGLSGGAIVGVIAFTGGFSLLFVWLSYRFAAQRFMQKRIDATAA
jgi:hypothetical protein